jgi:hypothetical protein
MDLGAGGRRGSRIVPVDGRAARRSAERPARAWALIVGAVIVGAVIVSVGFCVAAARFALGRIRTALLATAAGVMFGLLAAVLDTVTYVLAHRALAGTLTTWQPYALAFVAPLGEVIAQSAFQAGPLSASLPFMYTVEPGSAIAIGVAVLGERISHTPVALAVEVIAAAGMVAGVAVLSRGPLALLTERDRAATGVPARGAP